MRTLRIMIAVLLFMFGSAATLEAQSTAEINGTVTVNSSATAIAGSVGKISNLAQGTTPRQIQFGIRLSY